MIYNPYAYQSHTERHIMENDFCGLFLDMGLGKTAITMTAANRLIYEDLEVDKWLVIAPKMVCESTWTMEAEKWDHLKHLKFSLILGSEKERKTALKAKADIYMINVENVAWLVAYYGTAWPFEYLIIDEISKFKSPKATRFKALRQVRPKMKRVIGLTGTPRPNGLIDLWAPMYLIDGGVRLGKTITGFREKYFIPGKRRGDVIYNYVVKPADSLFGDDIYEKEIYEKIGDICISMKKEDYLDLPETIYRDINIKFSPEVELRYKKFEKEQILSLSDLEQITAFNAAGLSNKLLQFANGAVYDDDKNYHIVHDEKLHKLQEIIEVADGKPVLVFYSYISDMERIHKHLKGYNVRNLKTKQDIIDWNNGEIDVMLAHPAGAGHGLNLQAGGNIIVFFGVPWPLEWYEQAIARLARQGQQFAVIVNRLLAVGTSDEDVVLRLAYNADGQDRCMEAVKARILQYLPDKKIVGF